MYATALRSDKPDGDNDTAARIEASGIRARGVIGVSSVSRSGKSVRHHVHEEGALRIRFPHEDAPGLSAVIVNTGGGMTGGDRFSISATAGPGSILTLTSSAAEKIYRSIGEMAEVNVSLRAAERSSLAWLPQEAILFDGARIRRTYDIAIDASASLILCDINCIGRTAMGETVSDLKLQDQWRISIGGQLCFADFTRIDGHASNILSRPAVANGAGCFATLIYCGADTPEACEMVRAITCGIASINAGAGLFNGICVARFVAGELSILRETLSQAIQALYGTGMPRSWST